MCTMKKKIRTGVARREVSDRYGTRSIDINSSVGNGLIWVAM